MPSPRLLFVVTALLVMRPLGMGGQDTPKPGLPAEAVWVMRYDDKLDGDVKPKPGGDVRWRISARNDRLSGSLADLKPGDAKNHKLAGEVVNGKTPLVNIRQDGPNGLTAYYTGKLISENRMAGTWYDNRGGAGDFEMTPEKK